MSIKPSVVYIKGVHDIADPNPSMAPDIGFPNIGLDKLFEGAIIKETTDTAYDSNKKYIHYDSLNNQVAIQDTGHFNCIKNGYYSIANGINHYYTKSGDNYNYNTVPSNINTWTDKWSFSNTIKNKDLYSISSESDRICVSGIYYKKSGNNYVKQDVITYSTYNNILQVSWDESNKYKAKNKIIKDPVTGERHTVTLWQTVDATVATSGYYLSVDEQSDNTYRVRLLKLTFDEAGTLTDGTATGTLYKLYGIDSQNTSSYYIKNSNKLEELNVNQSSHTFTTDPITDHSFYIYQKGADWSYPNTEDPEYYIFTTQDGTYVTGDFPLYTAATVTEIIKTSHTSYTIYEKTAVKVNYYYSNKASSLQFVFTDKNIDGVLEACGLSDNIKKYVHLTNLKYNKN